MHLIEQKRTSDVGHEMNKAHKPQNTTHRSIHNFIFKNLLKIMRSISTFDFLNN